MSAPHRLLAVSVVVALAGGCGIPTDDEPTLADRDDVPFGLLDDEAPATSSTTSTTTRAGRGREVSVCFFFGPRLVEVTRPAPADTTGLASVLAVVTAADEGAGGPELSTALADETVVESVTVSGGVAEVDLGTLFADAGATEQRRMVAQLVCTLTAQPGIGSVAFSLAGGPVEVPVGSGSLTDQPVSRDDYAELIG